MEDTQRIVKCGQLSLHTAGGFFKKKWHSKYLVLYDGSKSGVKRLELFDSEIKFKKQQPAKIIPLVDCVRVVTCQRNKTTYTFEVRTNDQFYLLAAQSFQDMNDWVNCLRLVAFGEASKQQQRPPPPQQQQQQQCFDSKPAPQSKRLQQAAPAANKQEPLPPRPVDVLLDKRAVALNQHHQQQQRHQLQQQPLQQPLQQASFSQPIGGDSSKQLDHLQQQQQQQPRQQLQNPTRITTASQALNAAASALAKTRQRQPSLLGACKPQPPTDSPFIQRQQQQLNESPPLLNSIGQIDTMTPTVRGQLIGCGAGTSVALARASAAAPAIRQIDTKLSDAAVDRSAPVQVVAGRAPFSSAGKRQQLQPTMTIQPSLDEEEENMLYCSIEDNPSEHNYRVKVIESELSLRCQLKCYQPTTPATVSQQYELIGNFKPGSGAYEPRQQQQQLPTATEPVTFYQLIVGPQELTLLNDYVTIGAGLAPAANKQQQQGLWSWPYQCIRRYGFDKDNCFMFEAGRKCTSGPGQFIVQTPKAYSIYQDVVKFVNELRSVSGDNNNTVAGAAGELPTGSNIRVQPKQQQQQLQASSCAEQRTAVGSVTQIPVSWAPSISDPTLPDSRKQFFDSLKQMGTQPASQPPSQPQPQQQVQQAQALASDQNQQQPKNGHFSSSSLTTVSSTKTSQSATNSIGEGKEHLSSPSSIASSSLLKGDTMKDNENTNKNLINMRPNQSDATPEETDESGYDQGDDSVDSSSSRSRSLATERLELGKRSSMSSSSSSTVSSNAGAPLYSVINRRSREATEQHRSPSARRWPPPQKPSETKQQRHDTRTSNTEKLLSRLIADGTRHEQDFEANLIRDVYSEITKLHATLAVTPYVE